MASRISIVLSFCLLSLGLTAQILSPVVWDTQTESLGDDVYALKIIAEMEPGWSVYSQFTGDGGPLPTTIDWGNGDHYDLIGDTEESGHRKEGVDDLFGVEVIKFLSDEPLVFIQKVKVKTFGTPIEVVLEFMCCDDEQCLPPTEEFFRFQPQPATPSQGATTPATTEMEPGQIAAPTTEIAVNVTETPAVPAEAQAVDAAPVLTDRTPGGSPITVSEPAPTEFDPVSWTLIATPAGENTWEVVMEAVIAPEWHLYGMELGEEVGPVPNHFSLDGEGVTPLGEVTETAEEKHQKYEDVWGADVIEVAKGVRYVQNVTLEPGATQITGIMTYQACQEVCLPPEDLPFSVDLAAGTASIGYVGEEITSIVGVDNTADGEVAGVDFNNDPLGSCSVGATKIKGQSFLSIFGLGFLGGLFALIMPCIFPMIPLTVNFFNKSSGSRAKGIQRAGMYGFFIFAIYIILSVPFHLVEGVSASLLYDIASNVWLNVFFFLIFMFFAGSFFGYYELTLPESWTNRSSRAEGTGGLGGIFFMALTLALVSFSCTGPILGSLLVGTASEGAWPLTAGMAGFGLALALPFALFAAFPQLLQSLPSSGGWLNSVKVVLGFVEVALAFKFLSNADLVGHWDLLKIEPFYLIWIACSLGIVAYLMGWISFPLDSKNRKLGIIGGSVAVMALAFAVYLGSGFREDPMTGSYQPLGLVSGIAPSVCYSLFKYCDCPQGIPCYKDLDEGLAEARRQGKPVMLDFTGYTCANCRKMEDYVWSKDKIRSTLTDDYILISLYVDDREDLPEEEHQVVPRLDRPDAMRKIDQVGEKWQHLQQSVYEVNSQPYYVLISPDGQTLNPPVAYTPDVDEYQQFLDCGLSTFKQLSQRGK